MSRILATSIVLVALGIGGCARFARYEQKLQAKRFVTTVQNPLAVAGDRDFIWLQIVDTVDDYFDVQREQPPRQIGGVITEGRLTTVPLVGSTSFEPWRRDSTKGFERLHATLQSIRRHATVRVIPNGGLYLIEVEVHKELEDLERPEKATAVPRLRRHDATLIRPANEKFREGTLTLGWIQVGRDISLEQEILKKLRARLTTDEEPEPPIASPWHRHRQQASP